MTDTLTTIDAEVTVYLNTTVDEAGRHVAMIDGYQPGHTLEPVLTYKVRTVPTVAGINAALEEVFFDLNVGDDPEFVANPKLAVVWYRRMERRRSLSVGDVVELLGGRYAVARCGFQRLGDTDTALVVECGRSFCAGEFAVAGGPMAVAGEACCRLALESAASLCDCARLPRSPRRPAQRRSLAPAGPV